ncbi:hypothetical protein BJ322DRAFT_1021228 [Thelephora terrestris]|uniref:Uncharacterized protein n=1 Tax=Thelephora terrestris TaxID=56493 RepID=A0A9P6HD47_9AGAM|nr:hypothetical protein BJ322DRAFT_1021228 [Thelephora terrestris]
MAPTASTNKPSKDLSKMSKSELLRLLQTTISEKEELDKKREKFQKKYKRAKKALDTGQHSNESAPKELIPYPTGKTHGRGEFNLADDLLYHSEVSKEDYNTFIASIHQAMAAAGISSTATWQVVRVGPLAEVLDVVREKFPWLGGYENDWPATMVMKQYLRNSRNHANRKARNAVAAVAAA